MKKRWCFFILPLAILIAGCNKDNSVIEKVEGVDAHPLEEPELIEIVEEEEIKETIEFPLEDEQIIISLGMVPILNEYLKGSNNREEAIQEMSLERIDIDSLSIYLMEFSCHNDKCSYLLFHQDSDREAILIADMAAVVDHALSPDETKLLFQFNRSKESISYSQIVVIDMSSWEMLPLYNEDSDAKILNYTWPFVSADWNEDGTIAVQTPDIVDPTVQSIEEWEENGGSSTMTTILKTEE